MPAPGPVKRLEIPQGPGVRWDSGVETGGEVAGAFDSMLAKLIVTGATREEALQRARRALDELVVEGMPTVIPFHRAVVRDEAFTTEPFTVHTRWIETEWDNQVPPYDARPGRAGRPGAAADRRRRGRRTAARGLAARPVWPPVAASPGRRRRSPASAVAAAAARARPATP